MDVFAKYIEIGYNNMYLLPLKIQKPLVDNCFFTSLIMFIQNFTIFGCTRSLMIDKEMGNMISNIS